MNCREFESKMSHYFNGADIEQVREIIVKEEWSGLIAKDEQHQALIRHLSECYNCPSSLLQYLETRGQFDYHEYPCFHLAYYSNVSENRCIGRAYELFSIIVSHEPTLEIVIGFCPWCGIELNTSLIPNRES